MTFLFDENFPKAARPILEQLGHDVFDFRLLGDEGAPDSEVMSLAIEKRAVILSTDRDFFHTLGRLNPGHYGILVIALKRPTRDALIGRLQWFLDHFGDSDVSGRSFQLRDTAWMVYPPFDNPDREAGRSED
tara:strand:- start:530 stop:925 length:396 start_codon:yes stop_codon:yes gene_type:complete